MNLLMPPDRTKSGFGVFRKIEGPGFVFDYRRPWIHLRQSGACEIRNVIGRLAQRLTDKLFMIVTHNIPAYTMDNFAGLAKPFDYTKSDYRDFGLTH